MIHRINMIQVTRQLPVLQHVLCHKIDHMSGYLNNKYSCHVEHIILQVHKDGNCQFPIFLALPMENTYLLNISARLKFSKSPSMPLNHSTSWAYNFLSLHVGLGFGWGGGGGGTS